MRIDAEEQGYITRRRQRSLPSCGLTTWTPDGTLLLKWQRPKRERILGSVMFNAQFAIRYSARHAWLVDVVSRKGENQYNGIFFADFYFNSKFPFFYNINFLQLGPWFRTRDLWLQRSAPRLVFIYLVVFFLFPFLCLVCRLMDWDWLSESVLIICIKVILISKPHIFYSLSKEEEEKKNVSKRLPASN